MPTPPPRTFTNAVGKLHTQFNVVWNRFLNFNSHAKEQKQDMASRYRFINMEVICFILCLYRWYMYWNSDFYQKDLELRANIDKCDYKLSAFCNPAGRLLDHREWNKVLSNPSYNNTLLERGFFKSHLKQDGECAVHVQEQKHLCNVCREHERAFHEHQYNAPVLTFDFHMILLFALVVAQHFIREAKHAGYIWCWFVQICLTYLIVSVIVLPMLTDDFKQALFNVGNQLSFWCHAYSPLSGLCPRIAEHMTTPHTSSSVLIRNLRLRNADEVHKLDDGTSCLLDGLGIYGEMEKKSEEILQAVWDELKAHADTTSKSFVNEYGRRWNSFQTTVSASDFSLRNTAVEALTTGTLTIAEFYVFAWHIPLPGIPIPFPIPYGEVVSTFVIEKSAPLWGRLLGYTPPDGYLNKKADTARGWQKTKRRYVSGVWGFAIDFLTGQYFYVPDTAVTYSQRLGLPPGEL